MGIMNVMKNAMPDNEENKFGVIDIAASAVNNAMSDITDQNAALSESEKIYKDMQEQSNKLYDQQIAASENREQELLQQQQDRTDFTIRQIEQQKEQTQKDYDKEQTAAYVDWQKQSNNYGVNAEKMATSGLIGTGYSESAQVAMYTAYQNRVASARASFELTKQDFNNAITEAQLQNNSLLAEIAYKAQQERLTLSMQKFQKNNEYLLAMMGKKQAMQKQTTLFSGKPTGGTWEPSVISIASSVANNAIKSGAAITGEYANAIAPDAVNFGEHTPFENLHNKTQKSLTNAGYEGATLGEIMQAVESGKLIMRNENGVAVFLRNPTIKNTTSANTTKTSTSIPSSAYNISFDDMPEKTKQSLIKAGYEGENLGVVLKAVENGDLIIIEDSKGVPTYFKATPEIKDLMNFKKTGEFAGNSAKPSAATAGGAVNYNPNLMEYYAKSFTSPNNKA